MAGMHDSVSKLWILTAKGGIGVEGHDSERDAALHLAYLATRGKLDDKEAALAAVDAFAAELKAFHEDDYKEPLPKFDPEQCTCHIKPPCGYCTSQEFAEE